MKNALRRPAARVLIALVSAAALAAAAGHFLPPVSKMDKRIVIIGFDGLSPEILEPMMANGELPNFSLLKKEGAYSRLKTTNPPQSPVAWSAFATGCDPGKNGVFDFIVRDPLDNSLDLAITQIKGMKPVNPKKVPSFWEYTSKLGVENVIIGCPVTFPPDKLRGRMLSGMGVPDILGTEGTFTFYTSGDISGIEDTGGKVFKIEKNETMTLYLIGPRKAGVTGKIDNIRVPFTVTLKGTKAEITLGGKKTVLSPGRWSGWNEVSFDLGFFRAMKGIFKFYLVETEPGFKLYISPIEHDPRSPFFRISYPGGYGGELVRKIGLFHTMGMPMDTWAVNDGRISEKAFAEEGFSILGERKKMLDLELGRVKKGVLFCYFEFPDIMQHMFWRYRDPAAANPGEVFTEEQKGMVGKVYKEMDSILGSVMSSLNKKDTLIVLSDHGFNSFRRAAHVNSWLRANGYLKLRNPYAEEGAELLKDVDWENTAAYSIGFGAIYLNMKGREASGIVEPGETAEKLKKELIEKLSAWTDTERSGAKIVSEVYSKEGIFKGPYSSAAPDLYIGFNIGYRASWQTAVGAAPTALVEDNLKNWSGDHLFDPKLVPGVLFINEKARLQEPSICDIAPTVIAEAGYPPSMMEKLNMDGSPIERAE